MDIESLVVEGAGQSFKGDDFRMLCRPCVYVFLKDELPIYVGMSGYGMQRAAQHKHPQAEIARAECDEVRVFPCRSRNAAIKLETLLIGKTQPKYNERQKTATIAALMGMQSRHATRYLSKGLRTERITHIRRLRRAAISAEKLFADDISSTKNHI